MRPISIGVVLFTGLAAFAEAAEDTRVRFRTQVKPILETRCLSCHNARTHNSGLVLETPEAILRGGALNGPAVLPGNADASPLIQYLRGEKQPAMPLGEPPLAEEEIGLIAAWIDRLSPPADTSAGTGASWPFTRPEPPAIPAVRDRQWVRNPIDALVLAKLEKQGMQPAPPASRRSLLRRVYFGLIGMPPTPEAMVRFLDNPSEDAYEQEIETLLGNPRYGERWGRHWLDLVRYADTEGGGPDYPRPHIWRYRDYVIRAFNQDRAYDRFIKEQVAGDLYAVYGAEGKIGLGFLNLGVVGEDSGRQNLLVDLVATTGSVFLGLTLECARCHDHKYDPIPTRDYYRTEAFFSSLSLGEADLPFTQYEGPSLDPESWKQRAEAWQRELDQRKELKEKTTAEFHEAPGKALSPGRRAGPEGRGGATERCRRTEDGSQSRGSVHAGGAGALSPDRETEHRLWQREPSRLLQAQGAHRLGNPKRVRGAPSQPGHAHYLHPDGRQPGVQGGGGRGGFLERPRGPVSV